VFGTKDKLVCHNCSYSKYVSFCDTPKGGTDIYRLCKAVEMDDDFEHTDPRIKDKFAMCEDVRDSRNECDLFEPASCTPEGKKRKQVKLEQQKNEVAKKIEEIDDDVLAKLAILLKD
jgi:hypothetical protein